MPIVIALSIGAVITTVRIVMNKNSMKSNKIKYFNYRKYSVKHKRIDEAINLQSKNTL